MKYIIKKLSGFVLTLLFASLVIFLIIHMIPGDPATMMAGPGATQADIDAMNVRMGLDQPIWQQYSRWLTRIVLHGDFGTSLVTNEPVATMIRDKLLNTFVLSFWGIAFAVAFGIPLGILSALRQNSLLDVAVMGVSIVGVSMPIFWLALLLVMLFSVNLGILPATGEGTWRHLALPTISIGLNSLAIISRMTRSSMLEVLREDYVRTAVAKGLPGYKVILKHALRNAMISIVTTIGIQFGYLLGGAVLTESVFVYPGIGRLLISSINRRDYTAVQGCMLVITALFVVMNTLLDLIYPILDPRIKRV